MCIKTGSPTYKSSGGGTLLYGPIVVRYCMGQLLYVIVWANCCTLLYGPIVVRYCMGLLLYVLYVPIVVRIVWAYC